MTITYPLTLPANLADISAVTIRPRAVVSVSESPITLKQQVQSRPGDRWWIDVTLKIMDRATVEKWEAFFLKLNGMEGTFLIGDPGATSPRGTPTGTPVVDGASQTGKLLDIRGWTNSSTGNLLEGDYIHIGTGITQRLHKILTASVDADGSGDSADVDIWPRLRESPADGASITTSTAQGVFRLASNEMTWRIDEALIYETEFSAVEAI